MGCWASAGTTKGKGEAGGKIMQGKWAKLAKKNNRRLARHHRG